MLRCDLVHLELMPEGGKGRCKVCQLVPSSASPERQSLQHTSACHSCANKLHTRHKQINEGTGTWQVCWLSIQICIRLVLRINSTGPCLLNLTLTSLVCQPGNVFTAARLIKDRCEICYGFKVLQEPPVATNETRKEHRHSP